MTNLTILSKNIEAEVEVQDQTSDIIDLLATKVITQTTTTSPVAVGATVIPVASVAGASAGNCACIIVEGEQPRFLQAIITAIDGLNVTINVPVEADIPAGAILRLSQNQLNVNGSVTPQVFFVQPPVGQSWDITRIIISITDGVAMDDGKFGGITALSNGVLFRRKNNDFKNIFFARSNADFRLRSFDVAYVDNSPAGVYGFGCRRTFAGQDKNGVVVRLDGDVGDQFQVVIQDDLTGLTTFQIAVQGHVVVD